MLLKAHHLAGCYRTPDFARDHYIYPLYVYQLPPSRVEQSQISLGANMIQDKTLRVLIAGGGIGGLSAAVALRLSGHEVEVKTNDLIPPILRQT